MAAYSYSDLGIICASVALICVHLARSICVHSCIRAIRASVARVSKILLSIARPLPDADEKAVEDKVDDPIDEEVSRLMKERQKKHMSICSKILCHAISIALLSVVANIVNGQPRWMTFEQSIVMLFLLLFGLVVNSQTFSKHEGTVYASYSMTMALSIIWIVVGDYSGDTATYSGKVVMLYTLIGANLLRLLATVYVMHFRVSVSGGVVCFLATCCKLVFAETETSFPISNILAIEAVNCISVILLSEGIRNATYAELLHAAKAAAGSIEKSAATTLLENVCDVMLPLDPALRISEDAPRFKAMLMLNPNSSVEGVPLDNYIPSEEDKTRLHQQLTTSSSSKDSSVRCFNVTMRDSIGNGIRVEMFSVAFETLSRSKRYMLGIREFSDLAPLRRTVELNEALDMNAAQSEHSEPNQSSEDATSARGGTRDVDVVVLNDQADASGSADAAAQNAPPRAEDSPACQLQELKETSEVAKLATTIALIKSWSVNSSTCSCCEMHAGVPDVQRFLEQLRKGPCAALRDETDEQCSACGVFEAQDRGDFCRTCRHARRIHL